MLNQRFIGYTAIYIPILSMFHVQVFRPIWWCSLTHCCLDFYCRAVFMHERMFPDDNFFGTWLLLVQSCWWAHLLFSVISQYGPSPLVCYYMSYIVDHWAYLLLLGTSQAADNGSFSPWVIISEKLLVGPPAIFGYKPIWAQSAGLSIQVSFYIRAFIITRTFDYMPWRW